MLRTIGGFISILSALLCIGVIVLAVRSLHHTDVFVLTPGNHAVGMATDHGSLLFVQSDVPLNDLVSTELSLHSFAFYSMSIDDFKDVHDTILDPMTTVKFSFLGFKTAAGQGAMQTSVIAHFSALRIPCWFLGIILAILPIGVGRSALTRFQRQRKGQCLTCGYDLRFSQDRCPECGTKIPERSATAIPPTATKAS